MHRVLQDDGRQPAPTAPPVLPARNRPVALVAAVTLLALSGLVVLFLFDPARHALYPTCVFKHMTGYDCPGCGGLRAVHQLLRGDVVRAFQLNAMVVLALPVLGLWAFQVWRRPTRQSPRPKGRRLFWLATLVLLVLLFGIARNLSFWPFGVTPM